MRCVLVAGEGIEPPTRGFSILATAHRIVTGIYCYPLQTSQLPGNLSPLLRGCTETPATPVLPRRRSEEHPSELQSLMRISYAVFCLKKKTKAAVQPNYKHQH